MRSAIVYYSYSGNTKKVAEILAEHLKSKGEADLIALKPLDESNNFFRQCHRAMRKVRAWITEFDLDLSKYDLVCLGTPVWVFSPAPAMNSYLDKCEGVTGKEVILFCTVGGSGADKCLDYMQNILSLRGIKNFKRFTIKQSQIKNREFVLSVIKETTRLWPNG